MPENSLRSMPLVAVLAAFMLSACLGGDESAELAAALVPSIELPASSLSSTPTATEADYLDGTARAVFRGRPVERTAGFVGSGPDGHSVCARAPGSDGYDYGLIVLQRRIASGPISQVEDDALILRGNDDTLACRADADWVRIG